MIAARQIAFGKAAGKKLPDGVIPIEYLQGDGVSYIETGVSLLDGDISCEFSFLADNYKGAFGYSCYGKWKNELVSGISAGCSAFVYQGNIRIRFGLSRNVVICPFDTDKHSFSTHEGRIHLDGNDTSYNAKVITYKEDVIDTFALFLERKDGINKEFNNNRIYSFKCEGVLDLIPVRVGNIGYMYDRVSGQLFGNAGTGAFILGSDAVPANGGGYNRRCVRRSYRRSWRASTRFSPRHLWKEVA